jgi:hypothetical protein
MSILDERLFAIAAIGASLLQQMLELYDLREEVQRAQMRSIYRRRKLPR